MRQFEEYLTKSGLFNTRVIRAIDASKKNPLISLEKSLNFIDVKREILEITRSIRY
jgi:hypothetical protein